MEHKKRQLVYIRKTTITINYHRLMSTIFTILIILLLSLMTVASADNTVHITYMSFVDPGLGFYKVIDETTHQPSQYVDHILTINQGDTVIWKNDADTPNTAMAIISEDNLFPDAILKTNTDVFPYVFNQGGKYTFHLGERTTLVQTILVRATNTPIPTINTPIPIPTPAATVVIATPVNTTIIPIPTPVDTTIIPIDTTPADNPVTIINTGPIAKLSIIQIVSMIVIILSIYITYRTGKDKKY